MSYCRLPNRYFSIRSRHGISARRGFTLVEMLVAIAILSILSLMLLIITNAATKVLSEGQKQNLNRLRARAMLDYMGRELRQAALAPNQAALIATKPQSTPTLQFLINPPSVTAVANPQCIFWQAPIATDDHSRGNMAEIGYFVRWRQDKDNPALQYPELCRYFVNPTGINGADNDDYRIYDTDYLNSWVRGGSQDLSGYGKSADVDQVAPGDKAHQFHGLFLDNVLGLWVQAYDYQNNLLNQNGSYDSSVPADPAHPLPAYIVLSIVTLDAPGGARLALNSSAIQAIKDSYSSTVSTTQGADANDFLNKILTSTALPAGIKSGASVATITVMLDHY